MFAALLAAALNLPTAAAPVEIRTRNFELHYRVSGDSASAEIELWYTRDQGASWQRYGIDPDGTSPMLFTAPAEGLYGFTFIARSARGVSASPPQPQQTPQRWVFVDYTPPLAQWSRVEPAEDFVRRRVLQLHWTAHDDHLTSRPIRLEYQDSVEQVWKPIEASLANTGRYDWTIPAGLTSQVTLKLLVHDRGGHVVERIYGPMPVDQWVGLPTTQPAKESTATRPADVENDPGIVAIASPAPPAPTSAPVTTRPGQAQVQTVKPPQPEPSLLARQQAEELYKQGSWHLVRGQYALAAERLREALEKDPKMVSALNDLAGVHYLQEDYDRAVDMYTQALRIDPRQQAAMRGAALAYVARKQYAQSREMLEQLLTVNGQDAEALLDLGDVLFMMGDRQTARQQWNQATTVDQGAEAVIRKAKQRLALWGPHAPGTPEAVAKGNR